MYLGCGLRFWLIGLKSSDGCERLIGRILKA